MAAEKVLAGRTILVTGGARRVGGEISRHLATLGARVLVHYHQSAGQAVELASRLPAGGAAFAADLSHAEGPEALFAACAAAGEAPDAVVHAAASFVNRTFQATTAADWDGVFALNARAFFLLAQQLERRRGESGGDLIAIGDAGGVELWTGYLAHCVAKAALMPLVRALAKAMAPRYRVNGVMPGPVLPPPGTTPEERERMRERTLLKRLGAPAHVARAVEFLLTCDFATGSWVEVTGGSQLWRGRPVPAGGGSWSAGGSGRGGREER
ncbi:MAG TPA: SDR family oxidoreductase [Thermoanaerobaculia bacterium]|nr:SDR family oxidoreductase [Thermoanaerobaculia bacterium]